MNENITNQPTMHLAYPAPTEVRIEHAKPAQIQAALRQTPNLSVHLRTEGTAKIVASKNAYKNGFAIVVIDSDNKRYGVAGFERKPSELNLAFAIGAATQYIRSNHIV